MSDDFRFEVLGELPRKALQDGLRTIKLTGLTDQIRFVLHVPLKAGV